jgi:hypothetical protein
MRNQFGRLLVSLIVICTLVALCAATGAAQRGRGMRPRARGYTKAEVDAVIRRVENRTDEFVKLFDKALDRSTLDGSNREDRLNEKAKNLEKATDELRRDFDRRENYVETRPEVHKCLSIAEEINDVMKRRRMGANTEEQWRLLRAELNTLADVYELSPLR